MSSTMPTSATWKMGALGFLLMATMNGLPLSPARCWNDPLMPQRHVDLRLHRLAGRADLA